MQGMIEIPTKPARKLTANDECIFRMESKLEAVRHKDNTHTMCSYLVGW